MQATTVKRVLMVVIAVFAMSLMLGCSGMEKRPADRSGYLYYPAELVNADRALDEARSAGKDRECPAEFNAAKDMVDKSYEVYMACRTQEAIDLANEATGKIKALCPAKPRAEVKPAPMPAPKVAEKVIVLEDVHFDLDKSTLTKEAQTILKRNIQVLKENPNVKVAIQGHTSAAATEAYNQKLSEGRAAAVSAYLIKEGGIAADRLSTVGYGETRLEMAEPNPKDKESAAAKTNRRVIFKVIAK
ncbi:MAG TPA: OmpA family protein [Dissulfurispiraceae bacterium]|nr:OmpA family protein [Dissulfurispiraceae bacterium]